MTTSTFAAESIALERALTDACSELLAGVRAVFFAGVAPPEAAPAALVPFWAGKGGLRLREALYDPAADEFVIEFEAGRVFRVPREKLPQKGDVFAVALDEFAHGVGVAFVDGSSTDFSSDWVLYEACDEYREAHAPKQAPIDFGARIREVRTAKGLKAVEVAKAARMAPSNYTRLESSAHQPSVETLARVSVALGVPLSALVARGSHRNPA